MTRRIVYGVSLWVFLGAVACTIAAIALPNWVSYTSPTDHDRIRVTYGLHKRCSSITGTCTPFPQEEECRDDRYFCSTWRTAGFFMNFSIMIQLACVVAYVTVLFGGRSVRESGWKVVSGLLAVVAASQLVAMALVAALFENDTRFFVGWELDKSWILCTVSWIVFLMNALGVIAGTYFFPQNDDYEPIPESR